MREKPLVDQVDVVIGEEGDERLVTVPKSVADRWPEAYRLAETSKGNLTAAAKRATDRRGVDVAPITAADDLPSAPDPASASAAAVTTAGTSGVTTEGATPNA